MKKQRFPKGWDEERVKKLIAELDARTDEEWIAADEAAAGATRNQVVVTIPASLLPDVRRLLASQSRKAQRKGSPLNGKPKASRKARSNR
jgi:hypothetical protein